MQEKEFGRLNQPPPRPGSIQPGSRYGSDNLPSPGNPRAYGTSLGRLVLANGIDFAPSVGSCVLLHQVGFGLTIIWILYNSVYLAGGASGQSIGKRVMQIRTALRWGDPYDPSAYYCEVGYVRALIRLLLHPVFDILPLCIGVLRILWSPRRQTFVDVMMKIVVIRVSTRVTIWQPSDARAARRAERGF